jgi:hypothetical protein
MDLDLWIQDDASGRAGGSAARDAEDDGRNRSGDSGDARHSSWAEVASRGLMDGGRAGIAAGIAGTILGAAARAHHGRQSPRGTSATPSRTARLITVALLVHPPMLHGIVARLLAADPEVRVVEDAAAATADVLVVSQSDPDDEALPVSMLLRSPDSRVLALGADARRAVLFELRPHRTPLGELSRESLLAAVRGGRR